MSAGRPVFVLRGYGIRIAVGFQLNDYLAEEPNGLRAA